MADPLSICASVAAIAKLAYQSSVSLYSFIESAVHVDQAVLNLLNEFSSLKNVTFAISDTIGSATTRDQSWLDDNVQEVFALLEDSLKGCNDNLQRFKNAIVEIRSGRFTTRVLRQPLAQIKLDLNASRLVLIRRQLATQLGALQLGLQTINLSASLRGPEIVVDILSSKMNDDIGRLNDKVDDKFESFDTKILEKIAGLERLMARSGKHLNVQHNEADSSVPHVANNGFRLKEAALRVISSARTAVSSRSTIAGDSIYYYGSSPVRNNRDPSIYGSELGGERLQGIERWTSGLKNLAEGSKTINGLESTLTTRIDESDSEDDMADDMFHALAEKGEMLYEAEKFADVEVILRKALKLASTRNLRPRLAQKHNDVILRLTSVYLKQEKFIEAKEVLGVLAQLFSLVQVELSPKELQQKTKGFHLLAKTHLELKDLKEAERYCKEAMRARRRAMGNNSTDYKESLKLLLIIHEAQGEPDLTDLFSVREPKDRNGKSQLPIRYEISSQREETPETQNPNPRKLIIAHSRQVSTSTEEAILELDSREIGNYSLNLGKAVWNTGQPEPPMLHLSDELNLEAAFYFLETTPSYSFLSLDFDPQAALLVAIKEKHLAVAWSLLNRLNDVEQRFLGKLLYDILIGSIKKPKTFPPKLNVNITNNHRPLLFHVVWSACIFPSWILFQSEMAGILLKAGHDPNVEFMGIIPIVRACELAQWRLVELLLEAGAHTSHLDHRGHNLLHLTLTHLKCDTAEKAVCMLVECGIDVNTRFKANNNTALTIAVSKGWEKAVEILLERGADLERFRRATCESPLGIAIKRGFLAIALLLLQKGADVNGQTYFNECLVHPLHIAVCMGNTKMTELLIAHGAGIEIQDTRGHHAPLLVASWKGWKEIVQILLKHGADINTQDPEHHTALHMACYHNNLSVIALLLDHGAEIDAQDVTFSTPLYLAALRGNDQAVKLLVERGANIEIEGLDGLMSLPYRWRKYADVSLYQLRSANAENSANKPTPPKNYGFTPLCIAVTRGLRAVIEVLLSAKAETEGLNVYGHQPLHVAADFEDTYTLELLINKGAQVDARNIYGDTALFVAAENGRWHVCQLLLKYGAK